MIAEAACVLIMTLAMYGFVCLLRKPCGGSCLKVVPYGEGK